MITLRQQLFFNTSWLVVAMCLTFVARSESMDSGLIQQQAPSVAWRSSCNQSLDKNTNVIENSQFNLEAPHQEEGIAVKETPGQQLAEKLWQELSKDRSKVDVLKKVYDEFSKDVNQKDNAALEIFPLLAGRFAESKEHRKAVLQRIGIRESDSLVLQPLGDIDQFAESHGVEANELISAMSKQRPWSRSEFPIVAEYLDENKIALDKIVVASNKPSYLSPLFSVDGKKIIGNQDIMQDEEIRGVARLLCARSMLRLTNKEYELAWSDIMAIKRLGRLVGHGSQLIHTLVGVATTNFSCEAARQFVLHASDDVDWNQCRKEWCEQLQVGDLTRQIDFTERLNVLQVVDGLRAASDNPALRSELVEMGFDYEDEVFQSFANENSVNYESGLENVNQFYSRLVAAVEEPSAKVRAKKVVAIKRYLQKVARDSRTNRFSAIMTSTEKGEMLCKMQLFMFAHNGGVWQFVNFEMVCQDYQKVIGNALAVRQYVQRNGKLPKSIEDYVDQFDSEQTSFDWAVQSRNGDPIRFLPYDDHIKLIISGRNGSFEGDSSAPVFDDGVSPYNSRIDDWGISIAGNREGRN